VTDHLDRVGIFGPAVEPPALEVVSSEPKESHNINLDQAYEDDR
jgi:hypothetical protein